MHINIQAHIDYQGFGMCHGATARKKPKLALCSLYMPYRLAEQYINDGMSSE